MPARYTPEQWLLSFWSHVDKTGPCWLWTAGVNGQGRGCIRKDYKYRQTHRLSWEMAFGPIPEGLHVLHKCDIPRCLNPDHLFLGTQADNVRDCVAKGRHGDKHSRRTNKLNPTKVRAIRMMLARGTTQSAIAKKYGVRQTLISSIKVGRIWKHVT
jgi:hypothetical protein